MLESSASLPCNKLHEGHELVGIYTVRNCQEIEIACIVKYAESGLAQQFIVQTYFAMGWHSVLNRILAYRPRCRGSPGVLSQT